MEKIPSFFYDFSKKESATQRQELAQEVKRKREEYFNKKKRLEEQKKELEENIGKKEQETTEKLAKIESLKQEIENLSKSGVKKFFNYFKLKKLQAERKSEKESNKSLELEKNEDTKDLETVSEELMSKKDLEQARLMVDGFYEEEKEK